MDCDKCSKYKQKGYVTCPKCNVSFGASVEDFYDEFIIKHSCRAIGHYESCMMELSVELKKRFPGEMIILEGEHNNMDIKFTRIITTKTKLEKMFPLLQMIPNYIKQAAIGGNIIRFNGKEHELLNFIDTSQYYPTISPFTEIGRTVILISKVFQSIKKEDKGKAFAILFGDLKE